MTIDIDELVADVRSGAPDRVDGALERATAPEPSTRVTWYDDLFDACQPVFETGDAAVRQSVVRLLRESYPALELELGVGEANVIDGTRLEDTTEQRQRYIAFLLDALDDDDGRVRTAAIDAVDALAPALAAADLDAETEALQDALSELAVRQPEEKRSDTERAMRLVGRPDLDHVMADLESRLERE